ncbi:MAG TPA: hypothetical protein VFD81_13660 [Methylomirabilota bacterium]|nr:hypothetical protein [Methylomirabilota bacterium]
MHLIERLNVTAPLDPYLGLKALAVYSGLSVRKLRQLIDLILLMHFRAIGSMDVCWSGAASSTSS